jgi:hypothetical protein
MMNIADELESIQWMTKRSFRKVQLVGASVDFYSLALELLQTAGVKEVTQEKLAKAIGKLIIDDIAEINDTYNE